MKRGGSPSPTWLPHFDRGAGPFYLAIADALEADIRAGRLPEGTRLPPQRRLAESLDIDFTTVSRAYAEATRRGLVEGRVGQGTFVRSPAPAARGHSRADLAMNLPPQPADPALLTRMWGGIGGLREAGGMELLLRYQEAGGAAMDRAAGLRWLSPRLGVVEPERLLVCAGAQGALLAAASVLARPGDSICAEMLTYPGFRALAAQIGLNILGLPMDQDGLLPEAFDAACRTERPKALYCIPTLHNPTTATMPLERRRAVLAVARKHGVPVIEDDAYGMLPEGGPPPLAALAPELVFHVSGLAKCLSPALRIAYLVTPGGRAAGRAAAAIRATTGMASPLTAAIASRWIEDGTAAAVLREIRQETTARAAIAARLLPAGLARGDAASFHLWLRLPSFWSRGELVARLGGAGMAVVGSDAFAVADPPEAVRIGLGAARGKVELREALLRLADLLSEPPALSSMVI